MFSCKISISATDIFYFLVISSWLGKNKSNQLLLSLVIFSSPLHLTIQFFFLKKCVQGFTAEDKDLLLWSINIPWKKSLETKSREIIPLLWQGEKKSHELRKCEASVARTLGFLELKSPTPDCVLCDLTWVSPTLSCIRWKKRKFRPVSFESDFHFFLRIEEDWDYPNHWWSSHCSRTSFMHNPARRLRKEIWKSMSCKNENRKEAASPKQKGCFASCIFGVVILAHQLQKDLQ